LDGNGARGVAFADLLSRQLAAQDEGRDLVVESHEFGRDGDANGEVKHLDQPQEHEHIVAALFFDPIEVVAEREYGLNTACTGQLT